MTVNVHLVGSVGLDDVDSVFETGGRTLGTRLKRIPDGEPGGRRLWISWQYPLLRANPFLAVDPSSGHKASAGLPKLRLAENTPAADLRFGELGYAREARASYQDFIRARATGRLPSTMRFQICLPTPLAVINAFCSADAVADIEPAYEAAMRREVDVICREIPHHDLCIQWDVCVEMVMWDDQSKFYANVADKPGIIARFKRLCEGVPPDVELGFHLCYGDFEGKHFVEPRDAASMTSLANELAAQAGHPTAYIHMPVPIDRDDAAFFAPLHDLRLPRDTELYLGLVHAADGVRGAMKRVAAARAVVASFGIASECGLGRCKTPSDVRGILDLHASVAEALESDEPHR
jgi:hypothetical protein